MDNKETPVLLLTGYLGSGKTTLLNRILRNEKGIKFAVIVNDIGEVNIDANLIEQGGIVGQSDDSLVALQNGCICCTLKADLVKQLNDIINTGKFDYIVIEASGICEPAPIAQTISTYPQLLPKNMFRNGVARLDAIVTVVDALRMRDEFGLGDDLKKEDLGEDDLATLVIQQIEFCNIILLNKASEISKKSERYFRHFKGGTYRYLLSAFDSETQQRMVVYQALYGEKGYWVRPEAMFFEKVTRNGITFNRFTEIDR